MSSGRKWGDLHLSGLWKTGVKHGPGPGTQPMTSPKRKNRQKQHENVHCKSAEAKVAGQFQGSQLTVHFSSTI